MKNKFYHLSRFMLILMTLSFTTTFLSAQVAINNDGSAPDNSAMLDVKSSNKGLLIPRLTTTQRTSLTTTAVAGLMVYDTDINKFFFFNGSIWQEGSVGSLWSKSGSNTYLTNTNDKVGIGTTSPGANLEVFGSAETEIRITRPSSSYAAVLGFYTGTASEWNFATASGNDNMVIFRGAGNTTGNLGLVHSGGSVGIGTLTPARTLEVVGSSWQTARISSSSSGAFLEFMGNNTTNWAFGSYGGTARILSTDNDFAGITDEYWFSTTAFFPYSNNARTLGTAGLQWSNMYSVLGTFSGAVSTGALTTNGNATFTGGNATFTGSIGVGTTTPGWDIDVNKSSGTAWIRAKSGDGYAGLMIDKGASSANGYIIYKTLNSDKWYMGMIGNNNFAISTSFSSPDGKFYINSSGQVGIGTTSFATGYKLSVAGKVICEELRVNLASSWPDYVFGQDYKLMSLNELDTFIQINGHLPNIPEAGEIQESGLEVGEMQRLMMEKIEELSLYIIQQQKEIDELKSLINKNQNQ